MIRKTWKEFRECKLLWWVNRSLHLFGWAIVIEQEENEEGTVTSAYPARVPYRGFPEEIEDEGFAVLTKHLAANMEDLVADVETTPKS